MAMAETHLRQSEVPGDLSGEVKSSTCLPGMIDVLGSTPLFMPSPKAAQDGGLVKGDRVGDNYEIVGPLGAGGMGQVYRARHRKLDREVALKVIAGRCIGPDASR